MTMNGCHAYHRSSGPFEIDRTACAPTPQLNGQVVVIGGGTASGFLTARPLSDADVERIARRVVELLREGAAR